MAPATRAEVKKANPSNLLSGAADAGVADDADGVAGGEAAEAHGEAGPELRERLVQRVPRRRRRHLLENVCIQQLTEKRTFGAVGRL